MATTKNDGSNLSDAEREMYLATGTAFPDFTVPENTGGNNPDNPEIKPGNNSNPLLPAALELDDEKVLAYIREKKGLAIDNLDDLGKPADPAPDPEKEKKKKEIAKVKFGLDKELITLEEHNRFQVDLSTPARDLLYKEFAKKHQGKTPEVIEKMFARKWGEDIEDITLLEVSEERKAEMDLEKEKLLQGKYPKIYSLESEYDKHVSTQTSETTRKNQVLSFVKSYKNDVEALFTAYPKVMEFNMGDKDKPDMFDFGIETELTQIKDIFLRPETAAKFMANYDREVLKDAIDTAILKLTSAQSMASLARKYHSRRLDEIRAGKKNLIKADDIGGGEGGPNNQPDPMAEFVTDVGIPAPAALVV